MPELRLGPFSVRTERAKVEAFRRSIGDLGAGVPVAFPICWLGQPNVREHVERACGNRLPLHEAQTFDYKQALQPEREYRLSVLLDEKADPPRLVINAEVGTTGGDPCVRIETLLRLVEAEMPEFQA